MFACDSVQTSSGFIYNEIIVDKVYAFFSNY